MKGPIRWFDCKVHYTDDDCLTIEHTYKVILCAACTARNLSILLNLGTVKQVRW